MTLASTAKLIAELNKTAPMTTHESSQTSSEYPYEQTLIESVGFTAEHIDILNTLGIQTIGDFQYFKEAQLRSLSDLSDADTLNEMMDIAVAAGTCCHGILPVERAYRTMKGKALYKERMEIVQNALEEAQTLMPDTPIAIENTVHDVVQKKGTKVALLNIKAPGDSCLARFTKANFTSKKVGGMCFLNDEALRTYGLSDGARTEINAHMTSLGLNNEDFGSLVTLREPEVAAQASAPTAAQLRL